MDEGEIEYHRKRWEAKHQQEMDFMRQEEEKYRDKIHRLENELAQARIDIIGLQTRLERSIK